MKTLMTALALSALITSAAFAASAPKSDVVIVNGKVVGQDPDLNIRSGLIRDAYVSEQ